MYKDSLIGGFAPRMELCTLEAQLLIWRFIKTLYHHVSSQVEHILCCWVVLFSVFFILFQFILFIEFFFQTILRFFFWTFLKMSNYDFFKIVCFGNFEFFELWLKCCKSEILVKKLWVKQKKFVYNLSFFY